MGTDLALPKVSPPAIEINLGDQRAIVAPSVEVLEEAQDLVVDSDAMMNHAQALIAQGKAAAKAIEEWRKQVTVPLDDAKKAVMEFVRPAVENYAEAERLVKAKATTFHEEREAKRREEQRRAEAAARAERERLEAEAREKARKAQEEQRLADEAARRAAESKNAEEKARLEAEAAVAQKASDELLAAARADMAVSQVVVAAPAPEVRSTKGLSFRERIDVELVDKAAVVAFVAANPTFINLLDVNLSATKKLAESLGDAFRVPGIKVTKILSAASKAAA